MAAGDRNAVAKISTLVNANRGTALEKDYAAETGTYVTQESGS